MGRLPVVAGPADRLGSGGVRRVGCCASRLDDCELSSRQPDRHRRVAELGVPCLADDAVAGQRQAAGRDERERQIGRVARPVRVEDGQSSEPVDVAYGDQAAFRRTCHRPGSQHPRGVAVLAARAGQDHRLAGVAHVDQVGDRPPVGVGQERQALVVDPDGFERRAAVAATDASHVVQVARVVDVGDVHGRLVPGHRRVRPLDPREPSAVGGEHRVDHEVGQPRVSGVVGLRTRRAATASRDDHGAEARLGGVEGQSDQLVRRLEAVVAVVLAHREADASRRVDLHRRPPHDRRPRRQESARAARRRDATAAGC